MLAGIAKAPGRTSGLVGHANTIRIIPEISENYNKYI